MEGVVAAWMMLALSIILIWGTHAVHQRVWGVYERQADTLPEIASVTPVSLEDLAADDDHVIALSYCYDPSDELVAYRVEAYEPGYNADVPIVIASTITADNRLLVGIEVVQQKESEYYGARIATVDFAARFTGRYLPLYLTGTAGRGAHVDGITGATVSSKAVVTAIEDARRFIEIHFTGE